LPVNKEPNKTRTDTSGKISSEPEWHEFIQETYGCLADSTIGKFKISAIKS